VAAQVGNTPFTKLRAMPRCGAQKIILIGGRRLAELLIEHNIGVAEEGAITFYGKRERTNLDSIKLWFFEIANVLVRLDHIASGIVQGESRQASGCVRHSIQALDVGFFGADKSRGF
jgi:hypothetical protein